MKLTKKHKRLTRLKPAYGTEPNAIHVEWDATGNGRTVTMICLSSDNRSSDIDLLIGKHRTTLNVPKRYGDDLLRGIALVETAGGVKSALSLYINTGNLKTGLQVYCDPKQLYKSCGRLVPLNLYVKGPVIIALKSKCNFSGRHKLQRVFSAMSEPNPGSKRRPSPSSSEGEDSSADPQPPSRTLATPGYGSPPPALKQQRF